MDAEVREAFRGMQERLKTLEDEVTPIRYSYATQSDLLQTRREINAELNRRDTDALRLEKEHAELQTRYLKGVLVAFYVAAALFSGWVFLFR